MTLSPSLLPSNSLEESFMLKSGHPEPPVTFFEQLSSAVRHDSRGESLSASGRSKDADYVGWQDLPPELMQSCVSFGDWQDWAKLTVLQRSWQHLLDQAAQSSPCAAWTLAQHWLDGTGGLHPQPQRALPLLHQLAGTCHPTATTTDATPNTNDRSSSSTCFVPAAKKLAHCYLTGHGVKQDVPIGQAWLEWAYYQAQDADAAYQLACLYERGLDRHDLDEQDDDDNSNDDDDDDKNSNSINDDQNSIIDVVQAAQWFRKAADLGHAEAMTELALCYELGCGVEASDEQAFDWYLRAAQAGHVTAKYAVGEAFEEARGVPQSDEEACLWYYKAAVQGDADSRRALTRLLDIARIVIPGVSSVLLRGESAGTAL